MNNPYEVQITYHSSEQVYTFDSLEKANQFVEKATRIGHDAKHLPKEE